MTFTDRATRLVIAVVIAFLYAMDIIHGTLETILLVVGGVFLVTSFIGWCLVYRLFRINSKERKV